MKAASSSIRPHSVISDRSLETNHAIVCADCSRIGLGIVTGLNLGNNFCKPLLTFILILNFIIFSNIQMKISIFLYKITTIHYHAI